MAPMLVAVAADLEAPVSSAVTAAGAYFLLYGLLQPVWGLVSDRFGRVRTLRATLVAAGLLTLLSALAWSPAALAATRGLAGAAFGAAYPTCLVYVGDTVPGAHRQRAVARLMTGVALGTAVAAALAGVIADALTWRAAFIVTGVAAFVLARTLRALPEPGDGRPRTSALSSLRLVSGSRAARVVLALAFAEGAVLVGVVTLLPTAAHAAGASLSLAGLLTAAYGLAVLGAAPLVGRLSRTCHPARLMAAGGSLAVSSCALMAAVPAVGTTAAAAFLLGLAWAALHTSLQTWATQVLPVARALVVSCFAGALFAGSSVAAAALGGLVDAGRFRVVFGGAAVLAVVLTVGATAGRWRWGRAGRPGAPVPEST